MLDVNATTCRGEAGRLPTLADRVLEIAEEGLQYTITAMKRREFCRRTGAAAGLSILDSRMLLAQASEPEQWRVFEITTRVEVLQPIGPTRVWLPTPMAVAPYQKTMGDNYHAGAGSVVMIETNANEPDTLGAAWDEGVRPMLTLTSRVADARPRGGPRHAFRSSPA